ncbi:hypothetical protein [Parerythrobacter jejuensis]|uniref:Uncharacterized protein n=1 Tax=Parerythrobacter jejuensis TaxID=795812 RepID=A0A845ASN1_9SPHN|nr:hypothetical protein [Parerythrobacter jejuensis]MXP31985.1 hypothetical protein [Parerythrobacter jejuensis]
MKRKWIAVAMALAWIPIQAQAKDSAIKRICVSLDQQARVLTVDAQTRCLRSGARLVENSLALSVDQATATINLSGAFKATYSHRIGPTDCMGSRTFTYKSDGVEQRRYAVRFGSETLGMADFTENPSDRHCFDNSLHPRRYLREGAFMDWSRGGAEGWESWREDNVLALVTRLLGEPPETAPMQPETYISMQRAQWLSRTTFKPRPSRDQSQDIIAVTITQHGLLDDSVSGQRFTAIAALDAEKWRLMHLFSKNMCARGSEAGRWVAHRCP